MGLGRPAATVQDGGAGGDAAQDSDAQRLAGHLLRPVDQSVPRLRARLRLLLARPTHAYMGLSPGLDFETKLFAKPAAPKLLERELSAAGYAPRTIAIGTNTDPYQPIERQHQIMRRI